MKTRLLVIICLVLVSSMVIAAEKKTEKASEVKAEAKMEKKTEKTLELKSEKDKLSYATGMDMGNFLKYNPDVNANIVVRAIKDRLAGSKPLLTEEESQKIMAASQEKADKKQQEAVEIQVEQKDQPQ